MKFTTLFYAVKARSARVLKRHPLLQVTVTLVAKETVTLGAGDAIYAATEKLPDGTLTTNKIFQFVAASTSNAQ